MGKPTCYVLSSSLQRARFSSSYCFSCSEKQKSIFLLKGKDGDPNRAKQNDFAFQDHTFSCSGPARYSMDCFAVYSLVTYKPEYRYEIE